MEFKGRIYKLFPIQSGKSAKGNDWEKQDFIFEYFEHETDRWSDKVLLSIMGDRMREADLHEGDQVIIGFGHNVRDWQGKYFNDVRCYKIEKVGASAQQKPTENATTATQNAPQSTQGAEVAQQTTAANANAQTDDKVEELPF